MLRLLKNFFGAGDTLRADGEKVSLVVLYGTYREITLESLRSALDELFPGEFLPPREIGNFVVKGAEPRATFLINSSVSGAAGMFMLYNAPGRYTEVSDFAQYIKDPSIRAAVEAQTSWLSVDLTHSSTSVDDAYRFIGKVIAYLAPADTAFVISPETSRTRAFDDRVRHTLSSGRRLF